MTEVELIELILKTTEIYNAINAEIQRQRAEVDRLREVIKSVSERCILFANKHTMYSQAAEELTHVAAELNNSLKGGEG
jgi:SMC interacting uncharacterized protein involved in chromosome segregation